MIAFHLENMDIQVLNGFHCLVKSRIQIILRKVSEMNAANIQLNVCIGRNRAEFSNKFFSCQNENK